MQLLTKFFDAKRFLSEEIVNFQQTVTIQLVEPYTIALVAANYQWHSLSADHTHWSEVIQIQFKKRRGYNILMFWRNFWLRTVHVQQKIFEKALIEFGKPHLYASLGTFYIPIDQSFQAQWVLKNAWTPTNRRFRRKCQQFRILTNVQRLNAPRIIDQFGCKKGAKRSVKMSTTNFYKSFFKNILLYMNDRLSKIRSLHTYVMHRMFYFEWYCISFSKSVGFC